jgi:hypothetical protein
MATLVEIKKRSTELIATPDPVLTLTLVEFIKVVFHSLCKHKEQANTQIHFKTLKEIIPELQDEKLQKKLVTEFLQYDALICLDDEFLIKLIEEEIIEVEEWDKLFTLYLKDNTGMLSDDNTVSFLERFITKAVLDKQVIMAYDIEHLFTYLK